MELGIEVEFPTGVAILSTHADRQPQGLAWSAGIVSSVDANTFRVQLTQRREQRVFASSSLTSRAAFFETIGEWQRQPVLFRLGEGQ